MLSFDDFKNSFIKIADVIELEKDYYSELDRAIGDGDHGNSMSIGWNAVKEKLIELDSGDCGDVSKVIAMTFLTSVGASIGPLYASGFLESEKVVRGKKSLSESDIINFWLATVNGIQKRGGAKVGDKTMMDTWIPAMQVLEKGLIDGEELKECFYNAVKEGEKGMKSTINITANKGRSTTLKSRAIGHQDPGATSAYSMLLTFYESLIELPKAE